MRGAVVSFPATYAEHPTAHLIAIFGRAPERLRTVLGGLTLGELRARPRPNKWSILEIAAHMADSELTGAFRFRFSFAQPGGALPFYDQDAWAEQLAYRSLDEAGLERTLRIFQLLRESAGSLLERLTADDWQRSGMHAEFGPVTLRNLLELYADHGERHIGQILTVRELLGKPLQYPLLLEERLY
jgi:uncharacterized damage-inducible protein DinB